MSDGIALTPEEQRVFGPLFQKYEEDGSMIVLGDKMRPLMERSGLPAAQLGQIWQVADPDNRGFLDQAGFVRSLRMLYHVQHGQQLSPRLANIPAGLPVLDRSSQLGSPTAQAGTPQASLDQNTTGASLQSQATGGIPMLTKADKQRFEPLFDRAKSSDGLIDGVPAKDIFMKAHLPAETLGKIWNLVDVKERGRLTCNEFVLAMHLIQCTISRTLPQIPASLPSVWIPWLEKGAPKSSVTSPAAASHTQNDWTIKPDEKRRFDGIFDSLDSNHDGILAAQEAVPLFTQSKLSEDVLARIWDLADTQGRGQLDHKDFSIAMFLMKMTLNGQPLPASLPPHLLESASATVPPQAPVSRQGSTQIQSPGPPPPREETARSQASVQAPTQASAHAAKPALSQQSTSSLNDLVSLGDAFFKPLEPAREEPTKQESPAQPKEKAFVPSSQFGQSLMGGPGSQPSVQSPRATGAQEAPVASPVPAPAPAAAVVQSPTSTGAAPQNTGHQESLRAAQEQLQQSHKEKAVLGSQLDKVRGDRATLEKQLESLRTQYDQEASSVHRTQQQLRQTRDEIAQLEKDAKLRSTALDALQKQHEQDKNTLAELITRKEALESQRNEHSRTVDGFTKASQEHQAQVEQHRNSIAGHESAIQQFLLDIEAAKSRAAQAEEGFKNVTARTEEYRRRREQLAAEAAEANRLADSRARQLAEAQSREHEAAVAAAQSEKQLEDAKKAHDSSRLQSQYEMPTQQKSVNPPVSSAAAPAAAAAAAAAVGSTLASNASSESAAPDSKELGSNAEPANSAVSVDGSVAAATSYNETPRTSPPGSEFGGGLATAPWNLPMGRPLSASSSVANNAPQSVRGDLDETETEQETREPSAQGEENDSFEFVDAKEGVEGPQGQGDISSSDDEPPVSAIPQQYGTSELQTNRPTSGVDDFDEGFDDLVDTKPDEEENVETTGLPSGQSPSAYPPSTETGSAGPDEWQQLFQSTQPTQPEQSAPIQELTLMGFDPDAAREALERTNGNVADAANMMLSQ